jgi:hypothetical protein
LEANGRPFEAQGCERAAELPRNGRFRFALLDLDFGLPGFAGFPAPLFLPGLANFLGPSRLLFLLG